MPGFFLCEVFVRLKFFPYIQMPYDKLLLQ